MNCDTTDRRFTCGLRPIKLKIFAPEIVARVEQPDELVSIRVQSGDVRPFESVAMRASKRKVFFNCLPAMLFSNDVVDLKR